MDEVQAEKKTLLRRVKPWFIAFAVGFIPGAAFFGYAMFHDLTNHRFDSDSVIVLTTADSALRAGLLCGCVALAVFAAISVLMFVGKRLFK